MPSMPASTKSKILLIDNYDSFTHNLAQYFWEMGFALTVKRNDEIDLAWIESFEPSHLVISPGPGRPTDSGICLALLREQRLSLPILGVCLGHQCIGEVFGASVVRAPEPKHGKTSLISHNGAGVFAGLPSPFTATRYHSLVVERESIDPSVLEVTAESVDDHLVMGLKVIGRPIFGVQFHPESFASEHGHQLLRNFVEGNL